MTAGRAGEHLRLRPGIAYGAGHCVGPRCGSVAQLESLETRVPGAKAAYQANRGSRLADVRRGYFRLRLGEIADDRAISFAQQRLAGLILAVWIAHFDDHEVAVGNRRICAEETFDAAFDPRLRVRH